MPKHLSPQPHVGSLAVPRHELQLHLAALAWLDVQAPGGREHVALPSDLFLLTVYGDDTLFCGQAGEEPGLQVVVSVLRTRHAVFSARGQGQLALALLRPAGLIRLLRAPLDGLTDRRVPLAQFCGRAEASRLRAALLATPDALQRLARLGAWVEAHIHQRHGLSAQQRRTAQVATLLQQRAGQLELAALCSQFGLTQRQLERDFRRWLGLSPAAYARLVRFQRAAAAVCNGSDFLSAALENRFADQSHLNRTFKALGDMTPGALARAASPAHRTLERHALAGRVLMLDRPASAA